jgi:hypothetical protein
MYTTYKNVAVFNKLAGYCKRGTELSGSIKCGEFLDWLKNC